MYVTGRGYDKLVGEQCRLIVAGECALMRVGLTSLAMDHIQAWTLYTQISGVKTRLVAWYANPFANEEFDVNPSIECANILEPTRERALIEYILFKDYFNEGTLIEGLKNYIWLNKGDMSKLYEEAPKFSVPEWAVTYWIDEAKNDYDD